MGACGRFPARCPMSTIGHNLPVRVTFQFLLEVRPVIELSVRYSAVKLMNPLPQPGQDETFIRKKLALC
jgi:hypothetical protein